MAPVDSRAPVDGSRFSMTIVLVVSVMTGRGDGSKGGGSKGTWIKGGMDQRGDGSKGRWIKGERRRESKCVVIGLATPSFSTAG